MQNYRIKASPGGRLDRCIALNFYFFGGLIRWSRLAPKPAGRSRYASLVSDDIRRQPRVGDDKRDVPKEKSHDIQLTINILTASD